MGTRTAESVGDLTTLSPTRIKNAQQCGLKFKYEYVDRIPSPTEGAALILGNVVHDGVQEWYGPDESPNDHRESSLADLFRAQWPQKLPPQIWAPTMEAIEADAECEALASLLVATKGYKAPRMTKPFQESDAWRYFNDRMGRLLDACDKLEAIKWAKDENPLKAYQKTMDIARAMERRWKHLPRPIAVETPFMFEVEGFTIRGRIDQLRRDPQPGTGEAIVELTDIKTGRNAFSQMEAFIQLWVYHRAVRDLRAQGIDVPMPDYIALYLARHDKPQRGQIDPDRHDRLALKILNRVGRDIITASYEPHYGFWCDRCDYKDLCEKEISIWEPGTEGLVLSTT